MNVHEPVRTCAACRTRRPQGVFVRMARHADGIVEIDEGPHRSGGRGAYLCPTTACVDLAERRRALQRALHAEVLPSCYAALRRVVAQRCADQQNAATILDEEHRE